MRKAGLLLVGCLLGTACGAFPRQSGAVPAFAPSPPGAVRQHQLPPGTTCRLAYADISEATGGFIYYPGGERQSDPSATVALPGNTPGMVGMNPGLSYVPSIKTWYPVPRAWVAPDGGWYVYEDFKNFQIKAAGTAAGTSGFVTNTGGWQIIGTVAGGVFLSRIGSPGAWSFAFGQEPEQVVDHGNWQALYGGALWAIDSTGTLLRHDVATGGETVAATGLFAGSEVVGLDASGDPIVSTGGALAIYHSGGLRTTVWPGTGGLSQSGWVVEDGHGIWFEVAGGLVGAPDHGVYLWTPEHGATLVSAPEVHVAGPCEP